MVLWSAVFGEEAEQVSHTWQASAINHHSVALCERDGAADEDTEQIELFVITAYPNTRMPAIILPMQGWQVENGIPPSVLLLYWIFSLCCVFWWVENNFLIHIHGGHSGEGEDAAWGQGGRCWRADTER